MASKRKASPSLRFMSVGQYSNVIEFIDGVQVVRGVLFGQANKGDNILLQDGLAIIADVENSPSNRNVYVRRLP